jgi:hypothetical protein
MWRRQWHGIVEMNAHHHSKAQVACFWLRVYMEREMWGLFLTAPGVLTHSNRFGYRLQHRSLSKESVTKPLAHAVGPQLRLLTEGTEALKNAIYSPIDRLSIESETILCLYRHVGEYRTHGRKMTCCGLDPTLCEKIFCSLEIGNVLLSCKILLGTPKPWHMIFTSLQKSFVLAIFTCSSKMF